MERMFAPWRSQYVSGTLKTEGCVMCNAVSAAEGGEGLVVHASPLSIVVMNLYPYNTGHVMVAPRRHLARLAAATDEEASDLMRLVRLSETVLEEAYRPEGLNVGLNLGRVAGAGVADHIHFHVLPRWGGDTNFMTVVAETRVVSEDPVHTAARLRPLFAR